MKIKFKVLCLTIILLMSVQIPVKAASGSDAASEAGKIMEYVMNEAGTDNYSQYLETGLIPYAGTGAEWNVISMKAMDISADYESYNTALDNYLDKNNGLKVTDYERIALAKAVIGHNDEWIHKAVSGYSDSGTIMGYIYGLMVADCVGDEKGIVIAGKLIEMQRDDGGFSLTEDYSDPDVTAMALQALAPFNDKYAGEIEKAVQCLSVMQRESGGYISCGTENAESSAQVLIALCALDIDYEKDERFIKKGNTIYDAILRYRCDGGGYSHTIGGNADKLATSQTLLAMACAARYDEGKSFIFSPEFCMTAEAESYAGTGKEPYTVNEPDAVNKPDGKSSRPLTGRQIKTVFLAVIATSGTVLTVMCIIRKSGRRKIIMTAAFTVVITAVTAFMHIESREEHYAVKTDSGNVITGIEVEGYDGEILIPFTEIGISDGDSVFDQLKNAVTMSEMNFDYTGSETLGTIYVRSIDGLSEFDHGQASGWIYTVNGEYPDVSCSTYKLRADDKVCWIYQIKNPE